MAPKISVAIALLFLAWASVCQANSINSYCKIESCGDNQKKHVLCLYQPNQWNKRCESKNRKYSPMSESDKTLMLKSLNDYRRKVAKGLEKRGKDGPQPSASNMRALVWDNTLAMMAQTLAQQCDPDWKHDKCRDIIRNGKAVQVRQNIVYFGGTTAEWKGVVEEWATESADMKMSYIKKTSDEEFNKVGHYLTMVTAEISRVGCGTSVYKIDGEISRFTVCNFSSDGSWPNGPIYKVGKPGNNCPTGTRAIDGLCV